MVTAAMAVPAKRTTFTAIQPDGTTLTLTRAGDEFHKYFIADDGQIVVGDDIRGYYFAAVEVSSGRIISSGVEAADAASRNARQKAYIEEADHAKIDEAMRNAPGLSRFARAKSVRTLMPKSKSGIQAQSGVGLFPNATYPREGSPKGLIILVQYTDVKFDSSYDAAEYFSRMISERGFSDYNATGSALDWFTDTSMGQFTPDFDVYGPITLPNNQSYYGGNDNYGDDKAPWDMVIDGCKLLDSQVNFKDYDTDGDGYVDNVFVFYAGRGEADGGGANTVWPHQWELSELNKQFTLDGVTIDRYACSNEWDGSKPDGIGTFVHEFSHVMGLPDLYNTNTASAYYTPCQWSVMDYGSYNNDSRTPSTYSIFERNALGWIDPIVLDNTPCSIELAHIEESNSGCIIPTSKSTEFFLLENRQQNGWDKYLPGHGMLIWHIDYNSSVWNSNVVNNTESHQYVDIEEANNMPLGNNATALRNWAFPGDSGQYTSFTDNTTPSMKTWAGASLGIPVTNITETGGIISFDVCGGKPAIDSPNANVPTGDQIGNDFFIASWSEVEGAVDYLLTVSAADELVTTTDTNDFGSGNTIMVPEGWSVSNTKSYTAAGNYGQASPSLRMESEYNMTTPEYEYPITAISFWAKGQGQTTNTATLYAVDGSTETELTKFSNWDTSKGATVNYTLSRNDVHQLKLVYNKESSGNLAIDDVVITTSSEGTAVLPDYNGRSSAGATQMRVEGLPADKSKFTYSVVAVDAYGKRSAPSNHIEVDMNSSGIYGVETDDMNAPVEYFNLQGVKVENPGTGIYIRRQGTKVEKFVL